MAKNWIAKVTAGMKTGAFGKATPKKIAAGKKAGGVQSKRAVLAQTFARFAKRNKKRAPSSRRPSR
jgi:hypothetical protein